MQLAIKIKIVNINSIVAFRCHFIIYFQHMTFIRATQIINYYFPGARHRIFLKWGALHFPYFQKFWSPSFKALQPSRSQFRRTLFVIFFITQVNGDQKSYIESLLKFKIRTKIIKKIQKHIWACCHLITEPRFESSSRQESSGTK